MDGTVSFPVDDQIDHLADVQVLVGLGKSTFERFYSREKILIYKKCHIPGGGCEVGRARHPKTKRKKYNIIFFCASRSNHGPPSDTIIEILALAALRRARLCKVFISIWTVKVVILDGVGRHQAETMSRTRLRHRVPR